MAGQAVAPLNYARGAVPGILEFAERANAHGESLRILQSLARGIEVAHKFLLPIGGALFETLSSGMLPRFRLPFEQTCLEFQSALGIAYVIYCEETTIDGNLGALIWEVCRAPIRRSSTLWAPMPAGQFVGYGQRPVAPSPEMVAAERERVASYGPFGRQRALSPFVLHTTAVMLGLETDDGFSGLYDGQSIQYGTSVALQMCAALACNNVATETIEPPAALVRRAAKNGARPFFTYHVLAINGARDEPLSARGTGSHASPRTHFRRGHIRHLGDERFTWVRSALVNPVAVGSVHKSYRVHYAPPERP